MSVELRSELQQAIAEDQLVLHYQPIVSAVGRALVGVEALVRWRHPERGLLPPSQFVPAFERAGIARDLTLWVLRQAILQSAVWKRDGEAVPVGVNLSPENLRDPLFRRFLDITLRAVGAPELLVAELPAATLTSPEHLESLQLMRDRGIRVAIDDVVGPSALADVPVDVLKIGRALTARVTTDERARADFAVVARDAKEQGWSVTAVGVEHEAAWPIIAGLGCDAVQGFLVSEALSTAELDTWRSRR